MSNVHLPSASNWVYDGDSITVDIDLGFGVMLKGQKIRLAGIDTPEIKGDQREQGLLIRDFVREQILNKVVTIETERDSKGKYGRWLATVWINELNLNAVLLNNGLADKYRG